MTFQAYNEINALISTINAPIESACDETQQAHQVARNLGILVRRIGSMTEVTVIYQKRPGVWFNLGDCMDVAPAINAQLGLEYSSARTDLDGVKATIAFAERLLQALKTI